MCVCLVQCLGMFVSCGVSILKFGMHVIDLRLDNGTFQGGGISKTVGALRCIHQE